MSQSKESVVSGTRTPSENKIRLKGATTAGDEMEEQLYVRVLLNLRHDRLNVLREKMYREFTKQELARFYISGLDKEIIEGVPVWICAIRTTLAIRHLAEMLGRLSSITDFKIDDYADPVEIPDAWRPLKEGPAFELSDAQERVRKIVKEISTGTGHDKGWPEDAYTGDRRSAYIFIVSQLGNAPKDDKGATQTPGSLVGINRPDDIPHAAWDEVIGHLRTEINNFNLLDRWLGSPGHLAWLHSHTMVVNFARLMTLKDTYLSSLENSTRISFSFRHLYSFLSIAIGRVAPPAAPIMGVLNVLFDMAGFFGSSGSTMNTTIAEAKNNLISTFSSLTTQREAARAHINTNWGRLETFGNLVYGGELTWPSDTDPIRLAINLGWQESFMAALFRVANIYLGGYILESSSPSKESFNPETGRYSTASIKIREDECCQSARYSHTVYALRIRRYVFNVGYMWFNPPPDRKAIQKIFGTNQSDISDPQLGIDGRDFFKNNPWGLRKSAMPIPRPRPHSKSLE